MTRRPLWFWALAIVIGAALLIGIIVVVLRVPSTLYRYVDEPKDRAAAEAATRTGMIAGLAGLAALGSLAITARTYRLTQQSQITDRYTKAIEQLGSDKLDVRLGGIYALERIAVDSKRDHPTVGEVLSAFVREHSDPAHSDSEPSVAKVLSTFLQGDSEERQPDAEQLGRRAKPTADVRAALTVLSRLPSLPEMPPADLSDVYFVAAELRKVNLSGFRLVGANLAEANLRVANLTGADLREADLTEADLREADLTGADLRGAELKRAKLQRANLKEASLQRVNLREANLQRVNLEDASLEDANLWLADLREANLLGANLRGAELERAKLHMANLTGIRHLTRAQLDATFLEAKTRTRLLLELQEPNSTDNS